MTILGAMVLAPDLGLAWADSEVFGDNDRSLGMVNKLAVNPFGFAFTMTGWSSVASRAASCVVDAPDFATALRRLPYVLRRTSEQVATGCRYPAAHAAQHASLIGFDQIARPIQAYRLTAAECFVPILDTHQVVPFPAHIGPPPASPCELVTLVERQLAKLREAVPHAVGGPVHVALIRRDGITLNRLCTLAETPPVPAEPVMEPAYVH